jgi:cell division initiation protein
MALTPVEIRHVELRRAWLRGYRRSGVDRLLTEIADSFEGVWRERADLADRLEELETDARKHRELENLLRTTLVSAERAAQDMKEQARRESDLIVQEAHAESRRIVRAAAGELQRLEDEARKIRAQLRSALEAVTSSADGSGPEEELEKPQAQEQPEDAGIRKIAG